jgi:hypothetical protein
MGVRRAENLLTSLEGILSARVVTTPLGEVSEIHPGASGLAPKQLVRNIESALLAQLGLKVDPSEDQHRADGGSDGRSRRWRGRGAGAGAAAGGPVREPAGVARAAAAPDHDHGDAVVPGASASRRTRRASDTPRSRVEAAAKAAGDGTRPADDRSLGGAGGAKIVDAFDRKFAFVACRGWVDGRACPQGSSQIKESAERAAVFAVLDCNQSLDGRAPADLTFGVALSRYLMGQGTWLTSTRKGTVGEGTRSPVHLGRAE